MIASIAIVCHSKYETFAFFLGFLITTHYCFSCCVQKIGVKNKKKNKKEKTIQHHHHTLIISIAKDYNCIYDDLQFGFALSCRRRLCEWLALGG
jgi:UDP-N-acetylmuramyl pentapeptide phosphotransferase/UDP-N-acetylglucosamine-1-phosphate transferase